MSSVHRPQLIWQELFKKKKEHKVKNTSKKMLTEKACLKKLDFLNIYTKFLKY